MKTPEELFVELLLSPKGLEAAEELRLASTVDLRAAVQEALAKHSEVDEAEPDQE